MKPKRWRNRKSYFKPALMRLIQDKVNQSNTTPEDLHTIYYLYCWMELRTVGEVEDQFNKMISGDPQ